ncbi:hypothetical protein JCM8097_008813 [Rhodosporidiobolus ruineniae]
MPTAIAMPAPMHHAPPTNSRLFHLSSSSAKASVPPASSSSSFMSKVHHFPLFGTSWAAKEDDETASGRDRRFSFGGGAGKGKARESKVDPAAPLVSGAALKRSKSARTSLLATARRLSSHKRPKDFPPISQPVLAERNGLDQHAGGSSFLYRAQFAMSSPELGTPTEESGQWAPFAVGGDENRRPVEGTPHSPMVKWAGDETQPTSSFSPLSPASSARPFSVSSSTPSAESFAHHSEASSASSAEPSTPEPSSPRAQGLAIRRARSPKSRWDPPILPSLSPPPASPVSPVRRSTSRSPELDEETREANRAEALAKLTSPTPTASKFPDELAAFPFPQVEAPALRSPPPRPTRPLPATPQTGTTTSLILPLPSARNTLVPEDPTTPPQLVRSNTVGLHPSPVPLDIDFRGRLVRARNSYPANASPGLTISSSTSSGTISTTQGSSRFSEWGAPSGSRKSSESSVTMSLAGQEREESTPPLSKGGLYALAAAHPRMVESAVDVMAIVEEDEPPFSPAPGLRVKRSPSKTSGGSPARRLSAGKRRISLEPPLPSHGAADVLVVPRVRARPSAAGSASSSSSTGSPAKVARPHRLSQTDRTFSSGVVVEPTRNEREELGLHAANLPFPSTPSSAQKRSLSPSGLPAAQRPRAENKRCMSDLHAEEGPSASGAEKLYGLGLGLPSSLATGDLRGRTRHESFAADSEELSANDFRQRRTSRRVSSGAAVRTKLVLREKGKATLTYQLGECIGRGQFGSVYRALNLQTGQVVAVKRIQLEGKSNAEVDELSNEVNLLQRLTHPSVVKYEGIVRTEHYLNIILEYVENGSLEKTLKQFGQLPESLVASYVFKILEGLAYLHEQGVVHCDLKAANILTSKHGNCKLSDFGVSLNLHAIKATKGVAAGAAEANGTPNWMAPEVVSLDGATPKSDIWSLGCTVCELIDGKPPYADLGPMTAMFRIVEDEMPPLPSRSSDELRAFLMRCFRKNPKERPSAQELFEDPWVLKHFDPAKDVRPQDSLPFIRRLSTEYRRPTLNLPLSMESLVAHAVDELEASPEALVPPVPGYVREEARGMESLDSGYRASGETARTSSPSLPEATEETPRPHNFVKTTFSKAIDCKICGDTTRRHAVLCSSCGLVLHQRCREFAPDCAPLRAFSSPAPIPMHRAPTLPSTPHGSPAAPFSLTDYLPFGKTRRPKAATPTSSTTSIPTTAFSPVPPTQSRATGAIRHLSNALLPKTRTPERTPPTSVSRQTRSQSVSTAAIAARERMTNGSETSLVGGADPGRSSSRDGPRVSLDVPPSPSRRLAHRSSHLQVTRTSSGHRALSRRKSHSRSVSQPVNPPLAPKQGDCAVM